jgi:hypothetical protein
MITDDDYLDSAILEPAEHGDWSVLARHIEQGGELTDSMRKFVASILRGKIRRSANRPPSVATIYRHIRIGAYVHTQQNNGLTRTNAIKKAVERYGVDARTVHRILKATETVTTRHITVGPDGKVSVKVGEYRTKQPRNR